MTAEDRIFHLAANFINETFVTQKETILHMEYKNRT
jgi:hypothetical protein